MKSERAVMSLWLVVLQSYSVLETIANRPHSELNQPLAEEAHSEADLVHWICWGAKGWSSSWKWFWALCCGSGPGSTGFSLGEAYNSDCSLRAGTGSSFCPGRDHFENQMQEEMWEMFCNYVVMFMFWVKEGRKSPFLLWDWDIMFYVLFSMFWSGMRSHETSILDIQETQDSKICNSSKTLYS